MSDVLDLDKTTGSSSLLINPSVLMEPQIQLARAMQEMIRTALTPALGQSLIQLNKSIAKSLSLSILAKPFFPYPFSGIARLPITKTEVETDTREVIPAPEIPIRTRSKLGLSVENGNIVAYNRRKLKGISSRNIEGRYLILMLLKSGLFLSDQETRAKFYIPEEQPYYWIKSKLQKRFRKIGLKINLERVWSPDGYTLIGVEYLH